MRYVLLRHECPDDYRDGPHWDFMLERDGVLATWSLLEFPKSNASIPATRLADHRIAYLDYEGPVSGGRGTVARVARGELAWDASSEDKVCVRLLSGELAGEIALTLEQHDRWTLNHIPNHQPSGG